MILLFDNHLPNIRLIDYIIWVINQSNLLPNPKRRSLIFSVENYEGKIVDVRSATDNPVIIFFTESQSSWFSK